MVKNSLNKLKRRKKTRKTYNYLAKGELKELFLSYHDGMKSGELTKKFSKKFNVSSKTIARRIKDFKDANGSLEIAWERLYDNKSRFRQSSYPIFENHLKMYLRNMRNASKKVSLENCR